MDDKNFNDMMSGVGNWEIDLSEHLTIGFVMQFTEAAKASNFERVIEMMSQVVKDWPFLPLDPAKPEDYYTLAPDEFMECANKVALGIAQAFQNRGRKE